MPTIAIIRNVLFKRLPTSRRPRPPPCPPPPAGEGREGARADASGGSSRREPPDIGSILVHLADPAKRWGDLVSTTHDARLPRSRSLVARMERSVIRDRLIPDYAALHLGYGLAIPQPPTSPVITGPNSSQLAPLKRIICICLTGAKSFGLVLILMPGSSMPNSKSFRLAACFITFSRVRLSPHCLSTCTRVAACV